MPKKSSKYAALVAELTVGVETVVHASPGEHLKDRIAAAARTLRLSERRVRAWLYGEVARVDPFEPELIRQRAINATRSRIARLGREIACLQAELDELDQGEDRLQAVMAGRQPAGARATRRR